MEQIEKKLVDCPYCSERLIISRRNVKSVAGDIDIYTCPSCRRGYSSSYIDLESADFNNGRTIQSYRTWI